MKTIWMLCGACVLAGLPIGARAAMLAYEGFDYANQASSQLVGQSGGFGWNGPWANSGSNNFSSFTVSQDNVSLTSPAFPHTPVGGRGVVTPPGVTAGNFQAIRLLATPFDTAQDNTVYISALMRKSTNTGTASDNLEISLLRPAETSSAGGLIRFGSTSGELFFLNAATNTGDAVALGETYFVVLKIAATMQGADTVSAAIYDPTDTVPVDEPAAWDLNSTLASGNNDLFDRVRLWHGRITAGDFDEIRVGQSWRDVAVAVPEPRAVVLLLGMLAAFSPRRCCC